SPRRPTKIHRPIFMPETAILWGTGSARRCWPVPDLKMSRRITPITG
ncbi:Clp protease ClpP, partial [Escherichia coli]|nr:Clp protease ClpP [Escherichia coli]